MIVLVTGGARSGKSSFAESLYGDREDVVYMATAKVYDDEMKKRVQLHQRSRPEIWRTYEGNYNLIEALGNEENYILDCITVLTSNIMFDISKGMERISYETQNIIEERVLEEVKNLIKEVREKDYNLTLVTNEVGSSIVPEHHISRVFRDIQGRVNQRIASLADQVYLVSCGIPVKIK